VIAFKGALKLSEALRETLLEELLHVLLAFRLVGVEPLGPGELHHHVVDTFLQDVDFKSLLLVGAIEAVLLGQVSNDAGALHNVETS